MMLARLGLLLLAVFILTATKPSTASVVVSEFFGDWEGACIQRAAGTTRNAPTYVCTEKLETQPYYFSYGQGESSIDYKYTVYETKTTFGKTKYWLNFFESPRLSLTYDQEAQTFSYVINGNDVVYRAFIDEYGVYNEEGEFNLENQPIVSNLDRPFPLPLTCDPEADRFAYRCVAYKISGPSTGGGDGGDGGSEESSYEGGSRKLL